MISLTSTVATLLPLLSHADGLAIRDVGAAPYHYVPVDFDYGADSRVTANFTFGTELDAVPIKMVMDTGSADAWVRNTPPTPLPHNGSNLLPHHRSGKRMPPSIMDLHISASLDHAIRRLTQNTITPNQQQPA